MPPSIVLPTVELFKAKAAQASTAMMAVALRAALIVGLLGIAAVAIAAARSTTRPFTYDTPKRVILQKTTWLDAIPQQGKDSRSKSRLAQDRAPLACPFV